MAPEPYAAADRHGHPGCRVTPTRRSHENRSSPCPAAASTRRLARRIPPNPPVVARSHDRAQQVRRPPSTGSLLSQQLHIGNLFAVGQTVGQPTRTVAYISDSVHAPGAILVRISEQRFCPTRKESRSHADSNALSPTVVPQRPLRRECAQNRRCGHLCWLLLISGLGVRFPRGAHSS